MGMRWDKNLFKTGIFDRLVDLEPSNPGEEHRQKQTFNKKELIDSVLVELSRLLNTRVSVSSDQLKFGERSVIDYGIPEFTYQKFKNPNDKKQLARVLKETIESFEPRLKRVRVSLDDSESLENRIIYVIEAHLVVESVSEPVLFPIAIDPLSGEVNLDAG
jgi:type VI secretion system protein ImpF